ncbi:Hypothetical protein GbCGDNIH3_2310 [Granulibacter bethesdensis]|uniref:Uncharacterized protein n=1 Tax=Granulibacter bethesdensis TaxID=364410 RepID=A0AAN1AMR8_9PROT|nr:Hypothetical protein GbCGDNIH3_2310 [Granulibacter bethesdensis]
MAADAAAGTARPRRRQRRTGGRFPDLGHAGCRAGGAAGIRALLPAIIFSGASRSHPSGLAWRNELPWRHAGGGRGHSPVLLP